MEDGKNIYKKENRLRKKREKYSYKYRIYKVWQITDRPTHFHERAGDGKQNILWGWPNNVKKKHLYNHNFYSVCSIKIIVYQGINAKRGSRAVFN